MRKIDGAAFLALLSLPAVAFGQIDAFTDLFARTCMQHFYSQDKLREDMAQHPALAGEQAAFFLGGNDGSAWQVDRSGAKFVVSVREDGLCAVFAQTAPASEVQRNFAAIVGEAPEPLVAVMRSNTGPNSGSTSTVSYAWTREQDASELLFTLTTSDDASLPVQAMASLGLVAK